MLWPRVLHHSQDQVLHRTCVGKNIRRRPSSDPSQSFEEVKSFFSLFSSFPRHVPPKKPAVKSNTKLTINDHPNEHKVHILGGCWVFLVDNEKRWYAVFSVLTIIWFSLHYFSNIFIAELMFLLAISIFWSIEKMAASSENARHWIP
ncbi:hypothetical protein TNCT_39061 [Trichonephila clavata]|uniref:Uncharacterized protein n=1 Tax=Trichonephila clavata TaxID=2740835 RepID=A0A8X6HZ61_TRICU|nr:hypothetical protein TNCT_39061 [Trichonephila clavata]